MDVQKNVFITGIGALIIGIMIGYVLNGNSSQQIQTTNTNNLPSMHETMNGMMHNLYGKSGDDFDKAFINEMIVHHEGAIEMAVALQKNTMRPELQELAKNIISAQSGEIEMMKEWRDEWFK